MKTKVACSFCGATNTKWESIYSSGGLFGIGSQKIGEKEVIGENSSTFYRCTNCGRFFCRTHYTSMCCRKEVSLFRTKKWVECPKCGCKNIISI